MKRLIITVTLGFIIVGALTLWTVLSLNSGPEQGAERTVPEQGAERTVPELGAERTVFELGAERTVPELGMKFVEVAPGSFEMGSDAGVSSEKPVHKVRISKPFWMGEYEVTLGEYREFMKASGNDDGIAWYDDDCPYDKGGGYRLSGTKFGQDDRQPVVEVSWNGAIAFCKWLTESERRAGRLPEGYEYRLPTEAEWEYCCRAGSDSLYCFGDDVSRLKEYANYKDTPMYGDERTAPVGTFRPNAWGLHDMHGNVWEWCYDWYDSDYYSESPGKDPVNTSRASDRVGRGGSWPSSSTYVRSARRDGARPDGAGTNLGFRVVLGPPLAASPRVVSQLKSADLIYVNWAEGIAYTNLAKVILEEKMGYEVKITSVDPGPGYAALAKGDYDAFMETWLPVLHKDYYEDYKDDLIDLGHVYEGTKSGLMVPEYVEIDTISELGEYSDRFDDRIVGIDQGAGVMSTTEEVIEEYGLDIKLLPSSGPAMTTELGKAIENEEWIVVTGWRPHWMFGRWDLKFLEQDKATKWEEGNIHILGRSNLREEKPELAKFLSNMFFTKEQLSDLMFKVEESEEDVEDFAREWMNENEEVIQSWIPESE